MNKNNKKTIIVLISSLVLFCSIFVFLGFKYTNLIDKNKSLIKELDSSNNLLVETENNNNEINKNIEEIKIKEKVKIEEYEVWLKMEEKIKAALSL